MITGTLLLYLLTLVSVTSAWVVGWGWLRLLRTPSVGWLRLFLALVCGCSLLVSSYAIWATAGRTVLLPVPLFLGMALYYYRTVPARASKVLSVALRPSWPLQAVVLLMVTTLLFALRIMANSTLPGQVATPSRDIVFYSKTTYPLTLKGTEAVVLNPLGAVDSAPQPYHYYELWSNALLAKLTSFPALLLLDEVVATVLLTVLFVGFLALYAEYFTRYLVVLPLTACSLFICGTYWPVLNQSFLHGFSMQLGLLPLYVKLTPVALFLLLGFLFVRQGSYVAAAWVWAALAMVYTTVAPAVCLGGGGFALYLLWRRHGWPTAGWSVAAYVVVTLWVGGFYVITNRLAPATDTGNYAPSYLTYLPKNGELKIFINYFIGLSLSQLVYYAVYFIIIWVLLLLKRQSIRQFGQQNQDMLIALMLFALAAMSVGTLLKNANDGFQFCMNLLLPLMIVGLSLLLAAALRHVKTKLLCGVGLTLLLLTAYNQYLVPAMPLLRAQAATPSSLSFVRQVAEIEPQLSEVGAILLDQSDYTSIFNLNTIINTAGNYLSLVRDNAVLVSLSATQFDQAKLRLPFVGDTALARLYIETEPLTQFVWRERQAGRHLSLPGSQLAFLRQYHVNFICASSRAVLPPELQAIVKRELKDPVTGQKFYLLAVPSDRTPTVANEQHVRWMW